MLLINSRKVQYNLKQYTKYGVSFSYEWSAATIQHQFFSANVKKLVLVFYVVLWIVVSVHRMNRRKSENASNLGVSDLKLQ